MVVRASRSIAWDVYEEHLDEAAFLWSQWESALVAANYTLPEVAAGPEARLHAHLDGLVLGGTPVAKRLLLPALDGDEPGRIAAAAWALIQAEDGIDYQDRVIAAWLAGEPPIAHALVRTLRLSPRADLSRIARIWHGRASPQQRAQIFDLLGAREPDWVRLHLAAALRGDDEPLCAAALRALRRMGDRALIAHAEDALRRGPLGEARAEAITTGIAFQLKPAWDECRRAALGGGDVGQRLALAMLATSADPKDRALVLGALADPGAARHAVWALGFAGDTLAADALLKAMTDDALAKVAGEAFTAITGLALHGGFSSGRTEDPEAEEIGDDDPPPIVRSEDQLLNPNPVAIEKWWQRERGRFTAGTRYVFGAPRTADTMRAALASAPMWRREVIWHELARTPGVAPVLDLLAWAFEQQHALGGTS